MKKVTLADIQNENHCANVLFRELQARIAERYTDEEKRLVMLERDVIRGFREKVERSSRERKAAPAVLQNNQSCTCSREETRPRKPRRKAPINYEELNGGEESSNASNRKGRPAGAVLDPTNQNCTLESAAEKPQKKARVDYEALNRKEEEPLSGDMKNLITESGGDAETAVLVIQKVLTTTDVKPSQARFSMPIIKLKNNDFLTEEEKEKLSQKKAMKIHFIEPCGKVNEDLELRKWEMKKKNKKSTSNYVIAKAWNSVAHREGHQLEDQKDMVQVWAYRVGDKLGLAMVKLPRETV